MRSARVVASQAYNSAHAAIGGTLTKQQLTVGSEKKHHLKDCRRKAKGLGLDLDA